MSHRNYRCCWGPGYIFSLNLELPLLVRVYTTRTGLEHLYLLPGPRYTRPSPLPSWTDIYTIINHDHLDPLLSTTHSPCGWEWIEIYSAPYAPIFPASQLLYTPAPLYISPPTPTPLYISLLYQLFCIPAPL